MTNTRRVDRHDVSYVAEARGICTKAWQGIVSVVRLGEIIFFSTATEDAWMLEPASKLCVQLAERGDSRPTPIQEAAATFAVRWTGRYVIDGGAFVVTEGDNPPRVFDGYPTAEIERMSELGDPAIAAAAQAFDQARARLRMGRNDPCPCGSGRKYKKCCQSKDESVAANGFRLIRTEWSGANRRAEIGRSFVEPEAGIGEGVPADPGEADKPLDDDSDATSGETLADELSPELQAKLDALWKQYDQIEHPSRAQIDALVEELLKLPPDATEWGPLLHELATANHPDMPAVFRRIAGSLPHDQEDWSPDYFYWGAAEVFYPRNVEMLREIAAGCARFAHRGGDACGAPLYNIEHYLLAAGLDSECLQMVEAFSIAEAERNNAEGDSGEDEGFTPWSMNEVACLTFYLRVGKAIAEPPPAGQSVDELASAFLLNLERYMMSDWAATAAKVILAGPEQQWTRDHFALNKNDINTSAEARRDALRLESALIHVAREVWHTERRPPGGVLYGLSLLPKSVYEILLDPASIQARKKQSSWNLLNHLRPETLADRLNRQCTFDLDYCEPLAACFLDAHETLMRFALRRHLLTQHDVAGLADEIQQLREEHELPAPGPLP